MQLNYLTDNQNKRQSVVVPIEEWKAIEAKLLAFEQHLQFYADLKMAFQDIKTAISTQKRKKTLSELIQELNADVSN
jgi:predicted DNA-binding protein YlxM (UPF0122 family)